MGRIVKDPDVRRAELIETAERLFDEKGYDNTAVADIVSEAGVAQGTFYYYFDSKSAMMDAVLDRIVDRLEVLSEEVMVSEGMSAVDRMIAINTVFREYGEQRKAFMRYIHADANQLLHYRIETKAMPVWVDIFTRIVEQGVEEGVFDTPDPAMTAEALLVSASSIGHRIQLEDMEPAEYRAHVEKLFDLFERILGAEKGLFINHPTVKAVLG